MEAKQLVAAVAAEVERRLTGQGAGHGWDHIQRVHRTACEIQAEAGGDRLVIELAALLHDVGDAKFHGGQERSGEFTREILGQWELPQGFCEHVVHIVDNISFRKRASADRLSLEGRVVQDADRLDALGAVGIVRTIEYGASVGQPFFVAEDAEAPSGVGHFYDKLFKLRELMNTETGRRIAVRRERIMRQFLAEFFVECGVEEPAYADDHVG